RDEIREDKPRLPRDDELVMPEGGRSSRFGEYKGVTNQTLRSHLEKSKITLDTPLEFYQTAGFKGTSKIKTKKFLEEGFRHIKDKRYRGYRTPLISEIP